jgi:hypothetical protein
MVLAQGLGDADCHKRLSRMAAHQWCHKKNEAAFVDSVDTSNRGISESSVFGMIGECIGMVPKPLCSSAWCSD